MDEKHSPVFDIDHILTFCVSYFYDVKLDRNVCLFVLSFLLLAGISINKQTDMTFRDDISR